MNGILLLRKSGTWARLIRLAIGSVVVFQLLTNISPKAARAAGAIGTAVQTVIAAISIRRVSDLDFGTAAPGDPAKTVPPGSSENSENASFAVFGEPGRTFSIILPSNGSVTMMTGSGLLQSEKIEVSGFNSFPSRVGTLGPAGEAMLYVGASRSALKPNQSQGRYSGTFTVNVVY